MTSLATVLQFSRWEQTADAVDPEADIGFFSMSAASAEQVTIQIHTLLDRAWEYIALAYKGRAHVALGYPSWDDYVDDRFSDLQLAVPREHRTQVVATLAGASMSVRAIAKLLGVGVATVHREMVRGASSDGPNGGAVGSPMVLGRDGKSYPRERRHAVSRPCTMCGEVHEEDPSECPWDLYAQGLGPHPRHRDDHDQAGRPIPSPPKPGVPKEVRRRQSSTAPVDSEYETESWDPENKGSAWIPFGDVHQEDVGRVMPLGNLLARMDSLREKINAISHLMKRLDTVVAPNPAIAADEYEGLATRIGELAKDVRTDFSRWIALVEGLRLGDGVRSGERD